MVPEIRRIIFAKVGKLKFVSHLDLCRTMRIAFIRSGIPIWYSEGFNPHPKMVFALTVSTGAESECEYLDIKVTEKISNSEIRSRLNAVLTDELYVKEVYTPSTKFTDVAYSAYKITFFEGPDTESAKKALSGELVITRRTKGGDVTSDISEMIKSWDVSSDGEHTVLYCVLSASQNRYLNPEYVAKAIGGEDYDIMRTAVLLEDGKTIFR